MSGLTRTRVVSSPTKPCHPRKAGCSVDNTGVILRENRREGAAAAVLTEEQKLTHKPSAARCTYANQQDGHYSVHTPYKNKINTCTKYFFHNPLELTNNRTPKQALPWSHKFSSTPLPWSHEFSSAPSRRHARKRELRQRI